MQTNMMKKQTNYHILKLRGTAKEVGYKHGEILRSEINSLFEERLKLIIETSQNEQIVVEQVAKRIWDSTKNILPNVVMEIESTARAANLKPWQLIVAGGFSDVLDLCNRNNNRESRISECSIGIASIGHQNPVLIGTWDTHASAQESLVLIDRKVGSGPRTIALSTAGWPMQQGLNEYGLSFAITNLGANKNLIGTTYIAALMDLSSYESSKSAANKAQNIPLCSARYFKLLDSNGFHFGIETDGKVFSSRMDSQNHTNHFVHEDMLELEGRANIVFESQGRLESLKELMGSSFDDVTTIFKNIVALNENEFPIEKMGTRWEDRTCATFIINPRQRKMWFTPGPPSQEEITCVSID